MLVFFPNTKNEFPEPEMVVQTLPVVRNLRPHDLDDQISQQNA